METGKPRTGVRSRSHCAERWKEGTTPDFPVLIPLVDMANHQRNARVSWIIEDNACFHFKVHDTLGPGQEIFNNYGPKEVDERKSAGLTGHELR